MRARRTVLLRERLRKEQRLATTCLAPISQRDPFKITGCVQALDLPLPTWGQVLL